jgi:hypothetical protein
MTATESRSNLPRPSSRGPTVPCRHRPTSKTANCSLSFATLMTIPASERFRHVPIPLSKVTTFVRRSSPQTWVAAQIYFRYVSIRADCGLTEAYTQKWPSRRTATLGFSSFSRAGRDAGCPLTLYGNDRIKFRGVLPKPARHRGLSRLSSRSRWMTALLLHNRTYGKTRARRCCRALSPD